MQRINCGRLSQYSCAVFFGLFALLAAAQPSDAADITVTDAKIEAGKLVIIGTTATPNMAVRLEANAGAAFNKTSSGTGQFTFNIVYLPKDCIVDLQKLTPPSTLGTATKAVVANCAPASNGRSLFFAQVNGDGTLFNSTGNVLSSKIGTGTYQVDFGRDVSACAFFVTQGEGGVGGAPGGITAATDRAGNANAAFVTMRSDANVLLDRGFHLLAVC